MTFRRAFTVVAVLFATVILSGCFVVSKNVPAGKAVNDDRLVGAWMGVDEDGDTPGDTAFLHFQKPEPDKPLRLVWVEDKNYQVYEFISLRVGNKDVFAATLIGPNEATKEKDIPTGYYLGFYEMKGPDDVVFYLLDAKKVGELIERGVVKGIKPPRNYDMATLTGSSAEVARFLASPAADGARADDPARLRRVHPSVKK